MVRLNKVSHSYIINFLNMMKPTLYIFSVLIGKCLRKIFAKVLETLKFCWKYLHITHSLCLFSLILEACTISEETMRKHHIQLRWKHDKKIYSKTEDTIEFMCQYGYRQLTPKHTFRATCREGKVVYPRCG